jgi:restriction system protein
LLTYCEPLLPAWFDALPQHEQDAYIALKEKHDALGYVVMLMSPYLRVFSKAPLLALPLTDTLRDKPELLREIPADVAGQVGYKQLYARLVWHGDAAIAEFRAIRERNKSP